MSANTGSIKGAGELRALVRLSVPIVFVHIGQMGMGFVDVVMVGHIEGADAARQGLAAVAVGHAFSTLLTMFGLGVLMALDPVISQAVAAGDRLSLGRNLQRGLVLAVLLSGLISGAHLLVGPALGLIQQPISVRDDTCAYTYIVAPSVLPFLCFGVLKTVVQACSRLAPVVWVILLANVVNLALNWLWIYGHGGFPALGVRGSAYATTACRYLMFASLLVLSMPVIGKELWPIRRSAFDPEAMRRLLAIGVPAGLQITLEVGAFTGAVFFMGHFGEVAQGAHSVAMQVASFTFMFPMGISFAAAVRVGYGIGSQDMVAMRTAARSAFLVATLLMLVFAGLLIAFSVTLASGFTRDPAVIELAARLLQIAGVFQLFDGLQVVAAGVLRGSGDTRAALFANIVGFWLVGIPAGLLFAHGLALGPAGLWWGLVAGLACVAVLLIHRARVRLAGEILRTVV